MFSASKSGRAGSPSDPYLPHVPLLLETSAASTRSTTAVDSSTNALTVTRNGTPSTGWTSPYQTPGYWSNYFNGSANYLQFPAGAAFAPGTGDFTLECWVYVIAHNAGGNYIWTQSVNGTNYFMFTFNSTTANFIAVTSGGGTPGINGPTTTINTYAWHHLAVTRSSGTVRVFVNGVSGTPTSNTIDLSNTTYVPTLCTYSHTTAYGLWNGYISNLRYVKGTAVYTSNFIPPTAPLTAISGTSLLTCQGNRFIDNSSNNFTVTRVGTPQITPDWYPSLFTPPAASPGAALFNGTTDYLSISAPNGGPLDISGGSNFTIETWFYVTSTVVCNLFGRGGTNGSQNAQYFANINNGTVQWGIGNGGTGAAINSFSGVPYYAWNHFAIVLNGSTLTPYLNGVAYATAALTFTIPTTISNPTLWIGGAADPGARLWVPGYFSGFRIVKGTAVYTANFTPPTAPVTAITNTSLLLNLADSNYTSATDGVQNNTFVDDSKYAISTITRTGTPTQGSFTPYLPTGYWSNYFDGTAGTRISTPANTAFSFGTGDFTVEAWIYPTASPSGLGQIIGGHNSGSNADWVFFISATNYIGFYGTNGGTQFLAGAAVPLNQWTHVAIVVRSTVPRIYYNGVLSNTGTASQIGNLGNATTITIGDDNTGNANSVFTGYISNLRVVKGTAVYTANFALSTVPLTAISGTSLLTCQSNRFRDNSTNAFTITATNTPKVQAFQPFSPTNTSLYTAAAAYGGSGYFNGTTDYLTLPASNTNLYLTGAFTWEAWLYPTATNGFIYGTWNDAASNPDGWAFWYNNTGVFPATGNTARIYWYSGTYGANENAKYTTTAMPLYQWSHLVFQRDGSNVINFYLNGVALTLSSVSVNGRTWSDSTSFTNPNSIRIGGAAAYKYSGYISNMRFVQGVAVYSSNFSPPATPVKAITNTSLLFNFTNTAIYDATTQNNEITIGSAQASTTQYKWTPASMKFNGTTDYLTSPLINLGSGTTASPFTVEGWFYTTSAASDQSVISQYASSSSGWVVRILSSKMQVQLSGDTTTIVGTTTILSNTWYYFALFGSVGNWKLFLGTSGGTATQEGPTQTGAVTLGDNASAALQIGRLSNVSYFNGYLQDIRFTRGISRYAPVASIPTAPVTATANTVFLLNTTSINSAQNNTFLDSSTNNLTITRNGTPTQGSVTPYWPAGYWSVNLNGSTDYLTTTITAAGTGSVTYECWFNTKALASGIILNSRSGNTADGIDISVNASGKIVITYQNTGLYTGGNFTIAIGTWYHLAVVRNGASGWTIYINGQIDGTFSNSVNITSTTFTVGLTPLGSAYFGGYVSNVRVANSAVYTSTFISSITPLTAITNTQLLTCQSNRFVDTNTQAAAKTITVNGTPRTQAFQPFSPTASYTAAAYGGSGYFNGSSDYLTAPNNAALALGAGDFTVEFWAYLSNTSGSYFAVDSRTAGSDAGFAVLFETSSGYNARVYRNGAYLFTSSSVVVANAWYHVAFVRNGATSYLYLNGVQVASAADSNTYTEPGLLRVGTGWNTTNYFPGYISNLRIVKGTAVYTAAFTPPTAPVTAITNTSLLLNFTNAGIYDAAAQNNAITVGDAQASTTVSKWSPSSMKFDGTGDYLTIPASSNLDLGSGNYTIEFWVYPTATTNSLDAVFGYGNFTTMFYHNASTWTLEVSNNGTSNQVSITSTYSVNTWAHFAITRSGNIVTLYKDGITQATGTITGSVNTSGKTLYVGSNSGTTQNFTGYIQDFRITNGVALYTASFPVPTSAFPTTGPAGTNYFPVEYLVVGGGGGAFSGGGGAGGYLTSTSYPVVGGTTYTVTVGAGGPGGTGSNGTSIVPTGGTNGSNSVFDVITATGGGLGGYYTSLAGQTNGASGGSGGGAGHGGGGQSRSGGAGNTPATTPSQGNTGGNNFAQDGNGAAGGGGGAGAVGANATSQAGGAGGIGVQSSITGIPTYYAGGGGGWGATTLGSGTPITGGGGTAVSASPGTNGNTNTGGGAGGFPGGTGTGGTGGSGIVVIAYPSSYPALSSITVGLTYTVDTVTRSGYRVYKFTAGTGTITI